MLSVIQLLSIWPILFYVVRKQFFGTFFSSDYPSRIHVLSFTFCLIFVSWLVLYLFYDKLSNLISIIGAVTGLGLVFIIPIIVNIVYYKNLHPDEGTDVDGALLSCLVDKEDRYSSLSNNSNGINNPSVINNQFKKSQKPFKDFMFYLSQYLLIIFGIFTLLIQFVKINFFGINIK